MKTIKKKSMALSDQICFFATKVTTFCELVTHEAPISMTIYQYATLLLCFLPKAPGGFYKKKSVAEKVPDAFSQQKNKIPLQKKIIPFSLLQIDSEWGKRKKSLCVSPHASTLGGESGAVAFFEEPQAFAVCITRPPIRWEYKGPPRLPSLLTKCLQGTP